jgi:hypothetical protein
VDTVYAVFEVKTTINKEELSRGVKQIQEVKKLNYLKKGLIHTDFINDRLCQFSVQTAPPIGVIVGYDTVWKSRETLEKHLIEATCVVPEQERWDMVYVIDQGFLAIVPYTKQRAKFISYVNLHADGQTADVGAMFLNFLVTLEKLLINRGRTMPAVDYRKEYGLGRWLWRMSATSFDELGNRIPKSEA